MQAMLHWNIWKCDVVIFVIDRTLTNIGLTTVCGVCSILMFQCGNWRQFAIRRAKSHDTTVMSHTQLTWCLIIVFDSDHSMITLKRIFFHDHKMHRFATKPKQLFPFAALRMRAMRAKLVMLNVFNASRKLVDRMDHYQRSPSTWPHLVSLPNLSNLSKTNSKNDFELNCSEVVALQGG